VLTAAPPPPAPAPLPANWAIPTDEQIGKLLADRIADRRGGGMVAGIVESGARRVTARGAAGGRAFNGDTIFEIGSMSKVFTALMLADMVERGEVALDDPAEKYLPAGARMPQRAGRQITLADLATHRSGLPRLPDNLPMFDPDDPYADYAEAQLLDFLARHELGRDIGSQYEYSNLGMGLLGYLLARRAGTDYETLLKSRITGPLGMQDTTITLSEAQKSRFAAGHDMFMRPAKPWTLPTLAGAGAIRSTANDLLIFIDAFIGSRTTSLSPAMKAMVAKRWPSADARFDTGLGWQVAKSPAGEIVMHDGGTGGFRSSMAFDPAKKRGVVVLANSAAEPAVNDLAIHLLVGTPIAPLRPVPAAPPPAAKRVAISLPAAELARVAGRYALPNGMEIAVVHQGDGLTAQLSGQPPFPIFAEAPLRFFWRVVDAQLRFVADDQGKVTGAVLTQAGLELTANRLP
jgi:CubicO group peptidase (beta-lactamase class C family)